MSETFPWVVLYNERMNLHAELTDLDDTVRQYRAEADRLESGHRPLLAARLAAIEQAIARHEEGA